MNWNTSRALRVGRAGAMLGLIVALIATAGDTAIARSNGSSEDVVGTWSVQVTVRDCATDAPIGAPFNSLVTIHRGGTISESAGGLAFAPGQRSQGHGTWKQIGRRTFRQRMVALILFDSAANIPGTPGYNPALPISPGFFAGWQTITHTLELDDSNHGSSAGTNAFYKSDGQVYRTGCSTAVAERFR